MTLKPEAAMVIAMLSFCVCDFFIKLLIRIPAYEIVFFRSIICFFLCLPFLLHLKVKPFQVPGQRWLIMRGIVGTCGLYLYFVSLKILPLAVASTLQKLSPLFTVVIAHFWLRDRIKPRYATAIVLSLAGVTLLYLAGRQSAWSQPSEFGVTAFSLLGMLAVVGSAFFSGLAYNTIRRIGPQVSTHVVLFYFPMTSLIIFTPLTLWFFIWPTLFEFCLLLGVGGFTQIAQYFLTRAFAAKSSQEVAPILYLGVLVSVVVGQTVFNEQLSSLSYVALGLLMLGLLWPEIMKRFHSKLSKRQLQ